MKLLRPLTAFLLIALAGCSSTEPGKPSAAATQETRTESSSASASSSAQDLTKLDPCELLSRTGSAAPLEEIEKVDSDSCKAYVGRDNSIRLSIHADLGLKDYVLGNQAEPSDVTIGAHEGKLVKKALTGLDCSAVIGVSEKSRVDVFVAANISVDEACTLATTIATAIEPSLP
ncbi:DUF3558 family protein [Actinosynnema pretiosum]|uniref:DUF3558 family protein n=1 Tax=Actinosynnema pretiosum TaxID=42197 RepID=UPI001E31C73F|nr:DUF3558 family protein [Actinosynnema pretiosum]